MKKAKLVIFILATTTSFFMVWPFCAFANIKSLPHFIFKGNTVYSSKMLNHICSMGEQSRIKKSKNIQTQSCAQKVTHFYRIHGYLLTKAKASRTDTRTIIVVEGKYAKIIVKSTIPGSTNFLQSFFQNEQSGSVVQEGPLDRDLLLLSDLPGVHVLSAFSPGPDYGTTNLGVSVIQAEKISGDVSVDNYGSSYTGGFRVNGSVSANDLFHEGDSLGAFGSSSGPGYNSGGINYTATLNGKGTLAGVQYSAMDYRLGYGWWSPNPGAVNSTVLSVLGSSGYGQSIGLWISQNVERTRNTSVVLKLEYTHDIYSDTFNSASGASNNREIDGLTFSVVGNTETALGSSQFNLAYMEYDLTETGGSFGNPYFATTPGFHDLLSGSIAQQIPLPGFGNTIGLSLNGQYAAEGPIDPNMEYAIGGVNSVAAYSTAILFGVDGYSTDFSVQHQFLKQIFDGNMILGGFYDIGGITLGNQLLTIMGPGLRTSWTSGPWALQLTVATPVGAAPSIAGYTAPVEVFAGLRRTF
jgi:hemolysin activation/secretion protein